MAQPAIRSSCLLFQNYCAAAGATFLKALILFMARAKGLLAINYGDF
jgi:hypothetical protein